MFKKIILIAAIISVYFLAGCATVPMAPKEQDLALKTFSAPPADKAGLYVFRSSGVGAALKKNVYIDGVLIGETAQKTYFYKEITPGEHQISTESEFSENNLKIQVEGGKNYFAQQYIKMGVFVGGANIKMVTEEEGMIQVRKCSLAK
jgi:hypothetical protein